MALSLVTDGYALARWYSVRCAIQPSCGREGCQWEETKSKGGSEN